MSSPVSGGTFPGMNTLAEPSLPVGGGSRARLFREVPSPTRPTRAWSHLRY